MSAMRRAWLVAALVLAAFGAAVASPGPVAVVTSLKGEVLIDGKPARLLQPVNAGAQLKIAARSGEVVLSYCRGGLRLSTCGPIQLVVSERPPESREYRLFVPAPATAGRLPEGVNIDRYGGGRPADPILLHVGRTLDPALPLEWRTTQLYPEYAIDISGPDVHFHEDITPDVVGTQPDSDDRSWNVYRYAIPADVAGRMKPNVEYELILTGAAVKGARGETCRARFRYADPSLLQPLRNRAAALLEEVGHANASDSSPAMELAALYLANDMLFPAFHAVEQANLYNPHVRALLRELEEAAAGLQRQSSRGLH